MSVTTSHRAKGGPRPSTEARLTLAEKVMLGALLAMGAGLLAMRPDAYVFTMDTAELSEMGRRIIAGQHLPLTGPQVASGDAGSWLGPLAYYLCALPFLFSNDALAAIVFTGGLWLLAGGLLFGAARTLFGTRVAFASLALFLVGAHAHLEHRLNFFSVLAVVAVLFVVRACVAWGPGGRPRAVGLVVAALGIALQLHVVHLAFVGIAVATALMYRPRWDRRAALSGLALSLLLQAPWLVEQLQNGGQDVAEALSWLSRRGEGEALSASVASPSRTLGAAMMAPFRVPLDVLRQQGAPPSWLAHLSLATLLVAAASGLLLAPLRARWRKGLVLLAAWAVVPLLLMMLGSNGIYSFHLVAVLPAVAVFAALGVERLSRAAGRAQLAVFVTAVSVMAAGQALLLERTTARVQSAGEMHLPMTMVLSYPDALYRFPVPVEFPSLGMLRAVEATLHDVHLPANVSGQVHGQDAMLLSFLPPLLPEQEGTSERPPPAPFSHHYRLARGACGEGLACLSLVDGAIYQGWSFIEEGDSRPVGFPLSARRGRRVERVQPPGDFVLHVITVGPTPLGMERITPPELEVRLGEQRLTPLETRVSVPFWISAERRYRVHTDAPAPLSIECQADGRVVVDLAVSP